MKKDKVISKLRKQIENTPLEYKSFPIRVKDLEKYNTLYPKAAKIIIQDFERISLNKVEHQKRQLEAQIKLDRLSQWQGFFASICMIISALICGILGKEIIATALIGISGLGLVKAILPFKGKNKEIQQPKNL